MAQHHLVIGLMDDQKNVVGLQCSRCGEIFLYVNGILSPEKIAEECPSNAKTFSQAAAVVS
jgi:hypothetical protein